MVYIFVFVGYDFGYNEHCIWCQQVQKCVNPQSSSSSLIVDSRWLGGSGYSGKTLKTSNFV